MSKLHADSIRKTINGRTLLNDIFISCERGEIVGLLGRNGSGKSTLLKIIFGAMAADNRFVTVDEKKTGNLYSTRNLIGYLPQQGYLPSHKKIKDLISCFCPENSAILQNPVIEPFLNSKVNQLSGGERRIIEVLLMLHSGSDILLFDEPFNGISPLNVETIKEMIKGAASQKAILITDHDYRNVIDIASRLVLIQHGNTRVINDPAELVHWGYLPTLNALGST